VQSLVSSCCSLQLFALACFSLSFPYQSFYQLVTCAPLFSLFFVPVGSVSLVGAGAKKLSTSLWGSEPVVTTPLSKMTKIELECTLIQAECYLLNSCMLLLQESVIALVQSGFAVRNGWKLYQACEEEILARGGTDGVHPSVTGGIQFGVGVFNLLGSVLPPIVLAIVNVLGFPSDKTYGTTQLRKCLLGGGLRSMLAAIMLGSEYILLPSFYASADRERLIAEGQAVMDYVNLQFPKSVLFLWYQGRHERLKAHITKSTMKFHEALDCQNHMMQLQHVMDYDLGWNYMCMLEWDKASKHFDRLLRENSWSKCFYAYAKAVCLKESGKVTEANELFLKCPSMVDRTYGGKVISVEQFAMNRAKLLKDGGLLVLSGVELLYLWNMFPFMTTEHLEKCLAKVDAEYVKCKERKDTESEMLCVAMKGSILRSMKNGPEAEKLLLEARDLGKKSRGHNSFVAPFAAYELGALYAAKLAAGDPNRFLKKAKAYGHDYFFKMLLHFRIHLLQTELKNSTGLSDDAEKDDEEVEDKVEIVI
jgi:hypothetical protein